MGKKALIVGGSGGIGNSLINAFYDAGYEVYYTYNSRRMEDDHSGNGEKRIIGKRVNVLDEKDVEDYFQWLSAKTDSLDALVYAAGIYSDSLIENADLEDWNRVIGVNLTGAFLFTKNGMNSLRASGGGRVLYIGSVMGESGCYGAASYAASKSGLIGLAKSVALENASKNVTANVLSLGYIDVGMTHSVPDKVLESAKKRIPMKKLGDPMEVAQIAVDICSSHMSYVSGQVIRCNGMLYV